MVFGWLFPPAKQFDLPATFSDNHKGYQELDENDPVLPPYFPLKLKKCVEPADNFFTCLEKNSLPNGDKDVHRNALISCKESLEHYKKCMSRFVGPRAQR